MNGILNVSISNRKLGAIPAIDLPAIITCRPHAECAKKCYACKGSFRYPNKKHCMLENLRLWIDNPRSFEKQVINSVSLYRFVRWHASGDIPSPEYLEMMCRVAKALPKTNFLAFTKRYEFVNDYLNSGKKFPKNLTIVFSRWYGDALLVDNPHNLPQSYVRLRGNSGFGIRWDARPCCGDCSACVLSGKSCWSLKVGQSVVFDEH